MYKKNGNRRALISAVRYEHLMHNERFLGAAQLAHDEGLGRERVLAALLSHICIVLQDLKNGRARVNAGADAGMFAATVAAAWTQTKKLCALYGFDTRALRSYDAGDVGHDVTVPSARLRAPSAHFLRN